LAGTFLAGTDDLLKTNSVLCRGSYLKSKDSSLKNAVHKGTTDTQTEEILKEEDHLAI
jgi:hypothetical protein